MPGRTARSRASRQSCVHGCQPVPQAIPGWISRRMRPSGAGSSFHGGARKNRVPTSMGGQASRVACSQSVSSSLRSCGSKEAKRSSSSGPLASSAKKARMPPGSSVMPVVPASCRSAINSSSAAGAHVRNKENTQPCTLRARPCQYFSRRSILRILPVPVLGSGSSRNSTARGILKRPRRALRNSMSSS